MYVIVTNHLNWHRVNLSSDRENTGTLKMQFECLPGESDSKVCIFHGVSLRRCFLILSTDVKPKLSIKDLLYISKIKG